MTLKVTRDQLDLSPCVKDPIDNDNDCVPWAIHGTLCYLPVRELLSRVGIEIVNDAPTKTLHNSTVSQARDNVRDINVFGDGDLFKLISKASSKSEGWMKSTKAMEIPGAGCLVQVTTQQGDHVAEAITFVPKVTIVGDAENRRLEAVPRRSGIMKHSRSTVED